MALEQYQQIRQLIEKAKHILVTFADDQTGDAAAAAIACVLFLEHMGKRADIAADGFVLPKKLSFLKKSDTIRDHLGDVQKFIITVDVADAGVKELSYDVQDQKLRIFVTPKQGALSKDRVRTAQSDFKYDLIIIVKATEFDVLGNIYTNNTDLFYKTPTIAIDYRAEHEQYATVNHIVQTASAASEVVYEILKKLDETAIDAPIAEALLTGMIANTKSFTGKNVRPHTLHTASKLMALGANRDAIIGHLYRTKSVNALKLWGRALSRLETHGGLGMVTTYITRDDFIEANAAEHDLYDIVEELIVNSPQAKMIVLFHEHPAKEKNDIHVVLYTETQWSAKQLLRKFHGMGDDTRASTLLQDTSINEAKERVIEEIKKQSGQSI